MNCSDMTAAEVDHEVMQILKDSYEEAKRLLSENREALDKIAAFLIEKETITGKEFMKIFHEVKGIPDSDEKEIPDSGEKENSVSEVKEVPDSGKKEISVSDEQKISVLEENLKQEDGSQPDATEDANVENANIENAVAQMKDVPADVENEES